MEDKIFLARLVPKSLGRRDVGEKMHIEQSLYEILGVSPDADDETIKKAYRKMAQLYHPDKVGNTPESTERFAQICKAYEILSDPEKKALYDRPRRARTFYHSSWRPPK